MRKIRVKDVLDLTAYEKQRKDIRPKIIEIKNQRRIHVGPKVTYLFETYDTMWYQVQEMTRAERIVDEEGIMGELNAYNELIPDSNQLSASMLIEIDDETERKSFLSKKRRPSVICGGCRSELKNPPGGGVVFCSNARPP